MGFFKKVGKAVSKATKDVTKTAKTTFKKATKAGLINPLGIGIGGNTFQQRIRKIGKIAAGAGAGFLTGGLPGAAVGGGLTALQQSRKGAGNEPLTAGTMFTNALQGAATGGLTGAATGQGLFAKLLASKTPTAGIGGVVSKSAATSPFNFGKMVAEPLIGSTIQNAISPGSLEQPGYQPSAQEIEDARQARIQAILDAYNKRKERYFYA